MKRITTMSLTLVALIATLGAVGLAETKSDYDHHYRLAPGSTWDFRTRKNRRTIRSVKWSVGPARPRRPDQAVRGRGANAGRRRRSELADQLPPGDAAGL